jgi:hypothetical protein
MPAAITITPATVSPCTAAPTIAAVAGSLSRARARRIFQSVWTPAELSAGAGASPGTAWSLGFFP